MSKTDLPTVEMLAQSIKNLDKRISKYPPPDSHYIVEVYFNNSLIDSIDINLPEPILNPKQQQAAAEFVEKLVSILVEERKALIEELLNKLINKQ